MKTFNFEDKYNFVEYLYDTYEKLFMNTKEKDYSRILVVAKYKCDDRDSKFSSKKSKL